MAESEPDSVPRQPEEPTPEQVLSAMTPCEPYMVKDFKEMFSDTSRWTLQRRLNTLVKDDEIRKKQHGETRVTYWIQPSE